MGQVLRGVAVVPALLMAAWLACWHLWLGATWWLALAVGVAVKASWRWWLPGVVLGAALVPWSVYRYGVRVDALTAELDRGGPAALGVDDLAAVWGLNLVMAGSGAALGFPEVALETALLAVPMGGNRTVSSGNFPRCAPKLADVVAERQAQARAGRQRFAPRKVGWRYWEPGSSMRAALALSPVTIETERVDEGLRFGFTVAVDYPPGYRLVLADVGGWQLVVEEGLFDALEQRGWLTPYQLTYETTVGLDEPRAPECEAWVVRAASAEL